MLIPNLLYGGDVEIMFNDDGHKYYRDNEKLIGVTTILGAIAKPALVPWAANMAADYVRDHLKPGVAMDEVEIKTMLDAARKAHTQRKVDAGNVGTLVHEWVDRYIKGENPEMPFNEELKKSVGKFLKWQEEYKVKFLLSEVVVYSREHNFCGTMDFIAKIGEDLVLGDVKTSSGIYDEYALQTAAYQMAREEEFPKEKYAYRGIIRIGKEGDFEWKALKNYERDCKAFLACKDLYEALNEMKKESGRY